MEETGITEIHSFRGHSRRHRRSRLAQASHRPNLKISSHKRFSQIDTDKHGVSLRFTPLTNCFERLDTRLSKASPLDLG